MHAVRAQYFFAFALLGSLLPYLSLLLSAKGLSDAQIGDVTSVTGLAILLGPVTMTALADLRLESKTLLGLSFAGGAAALAALLWAQGFWWILLAFGVYAVLTMPIMPVQDGLNFTVQTQRRQLGRATIPYHHIRVFGTFGFIVPSLVLYLWLARGAPVHVTIAVAAGFCALGALNSFLLPATRSGASGTKGPPPDIPEPREPNDTNHNHGSTEAAAPSAGANDSSRARRFKQWPTVAAARALTEPRVLAFTVAMWLCHLAAAGYYTFYPLYLTRRIELGEQWVGLIANVGVAVEAGFMLAFGLLLRRLGLRALVALGAGCMALRFGLLFLIPNVWVAVGTQVFHGMTVLTIHVAAPVYLNQRAATSYRSSMQGLYTMLVYGTARILGNILFGRVAEWDLLAVFGTSALLCVGAALLFALLFTDHGQTVPHEA